MAAEAIGLKSRIKTERHLHIYCIQWSAESRVGKVVPEGGFDIKLLTDTYSICARITCWKLKTQFGNAVGASGFRRGDQIHLSNGDRFFICYVRPVGNRITGWRRFLSERRLDQGQAAKQGE